MILSKLPRNSSIRCRMRVGAGDLCRIRRDAPRGDHAQVRQAFHLPNDGVDAQVVDEDVGEARGLGEKEDPVHRRRAEISVDEEDPFFLRGKGGGEVHGDNRFPSPGPRSSRRWSSTPCPAR